MKKSKLKKGTSFIEIILAVLFISMLSMMLMNTSSLFLVNSDNKLISEVSILTNSYVNQSKNRCEATGEFTVTNESVIVLGKFPVTMKYSCLLYSGATNLYQIKVDAVYKGRTKHVESYLYH